MALDTREVNRAVSVRTKRPGLKAEMLMKLAAARTLNVARAAFANDSDLLLL